MSHISNTPESLLPRSDSRNPATTCRGITTQGRPCRRAVTPSPSPSPASILRKKGPRQDAVDVDSLYCWQHKDQASNSAPVAQAANSEGSLKPRTSIDTLMDRLGVLDLNSGTQKPPNRRHTNQTGLGEKPRPRPKKKKKTFCCFEIVDEESDEDARPSKPIQKPMSSRRPQNPYQGRPSQHGRTSSFGQQKPSRPNKIPRKSSQTESLLSWIPSTLSPQTTSTLLAELSKPISEADEEGYIYMFWVTPPTTNSRGNVRVQPPVPKEIARSLLPQPPQKDNTLRPPTQPRSVSDAISAARDLNALTSNPTSTSPGSIRLKIGRTSNVHRRLAEWTRQCSHDLTLIRYYPYTPSSSANSSPARSPQPRPQTATLMPGRKVPHVHRVERLIHLELANIRIRDLGQCIECGKEHREWFEVEAHKEALRKVDECIRRWISWGESMK